MFAISSNNVFTGYADSVVYIRYHPGGFYVLCEADEAEGFCAKMAVPMTDKDGNPTGETEEVVNEWDNSAYSLSGAITDHRDGTVSIKMGKPTEAETLRAQLAEIEEAYDEN